jgi:hypothetical protein
MIKDWAKKGGDTVNHSKYVNLFNTDYKELENHYLQGLGLNSPG